MFLFCFFKINFHLVNFNQHYFNPLLNLNLNPIIKEVPPIVIITFLKILHTANLNLTLIIVKFLLIIIGLIPNVF